MLTPSGYVRALRADGEALAAAAENNLDQPVPTCPGWTIADLVQHTGWVHRHKSAAVRRGGIEPADVQYWEQPTPPAKSLLDWYREGLADLVDVLGSSDPEAPAHSWAGDHRVAFWQRRMAQETLVHRYDAEAAAQEFTPIDAALAADGVDEFLRIFVPANDEAYPGPHGVIVVAPDDGGAGWSVALGDEPVISSGLTTPADATLRAVTADVLLVLWRRKQPDAVRVDGDQELVRSFLAWSDLD